MFTTIGNFADIGSRDGYHHMWGDGAFGWVWGAVMMVAMMAVAIALVVWLVRGGAQSGHGSAPDPTHEARSILATRLANGDLTPEDYRERLSHLD